jgi:ABC-type sugar transport system ATPase subunit
MTLRHSDFLVIIGSSGAGKSTLLRCLNRLIRPSFGTVELLGEDVTRAGGARLHRIRSKVGMIFQQFHLVRRLSVLENVLSGRLRFQHSPIRHGLSLLRWFNRSEKEKAFECLKQVGIADLDGDGCYDFVIKQPRDNIDPYEKYWKPSPNTYKLEAYRHDGRFLWRHDLGWAIEQGIWYSPYVVYDLDGDGRAEVAVKTGQGDPRDADGRVQTGPEYLSILDGRTGEPMVRVDWPSRANFPSYNYASRNQLGVAYLDGKTPALLVARGTYNYMVLIAYQFKDGKLRELWRWDNKDAPKTFWGQGAHWMHSGDVDADGRDEVALGSVMIDDHGKPLWTTGLGHPDHFYLGDLDPQRPGLEIYFGIEPRRKENAMCMVDACTGKILWGHQEATQHIHSSGLCSDIDPQHPGSECYSGERDFKDKRWLRDCKGHVIATNDLGGLAPRAAYWDADPQRELVTGGRITKYQGQTLRPRIEGDVIAVVDLLGDWREEIITSVAGQLRIYMTTIPAADRRTCLMEDPIYRTDVTHAAMGYYQVPMTSYDLATGKGRFGAR